MQRSHTVLAPPGQAADEAFVEQVYQVSSKPFSPNCSMGVVRANVASPDVGLAIRRAQAACGAGLPGGHTRTLRCLAEAPPICRACQCHAVSAMVAATDK